LKTVVNGPHRGEVSKICFHPFEPIAVTTSLDKKFKIWTLNQDKEPFWECGWSLSYGEYGCMDASFSYDGSLLAIIHNHVITLWDPFTHLLQTTLSYPSKNESLRGIGFLAGKEFLVAVSSIQVFVWNLLTCTIWLSIQSNPIRTLAVHPTQPFFAISTKYNNDNHIVIYDLSTTTKTTQPAYMWKTERLVESMAFFDNSNKNDTPENSDIKIVYITQNNDICILKKPSPTKPMTALISTMKPTNNSDQASVFLQLYGEKGLEKSKGREHQTQGNIHNSQQIDISTVLFENMPSHAIPPPSTLYSSYMNLLLFKSLKKTNQTEDDDGLQAEIEKSSTISLQQNTEPTLKEIINVLNQEAEDLSSTQTPIHQFYSEMFEFFTNSETLPNTTGKPSRKSSKNSPLTKGKTKGTSDTSKPKTTSTLNKLKISTTPTLELTTPTELTSSMPISQTRTTPTSQTSVPTLPQTMKPKKKKKTKIVQNGNQETSMTLNGNSSPSPSSDLQSSQKMTKRKRSTIHTTENGNET